jgi:histone deacetylase complex regulatory component SIN3
MLRNFPKKCKTTVLERVKSKLNELLDARNNQAKKNWFEVAEKNFHRSLDHRSFYFKKHEKKITT